MKKVAIYTVSGDDIISEQIIYSDLGSKTPTSDILFKVVEEMPRFPGCEGSEGTAQEKEACAKQKMLEFIYKNIKYPKAARDGGIQGMNVVRFVIEIDGSISNVELVRDIGGTTGEESTRITNLMNEMEEKWIPGRQKGQAVRVQYNLPIRFKLEGDQDESVEKISYQIFLKDGTSLALSETNLGQDLDPKHIIKVNVIKEKELLKTAYPELDNSAGVVQIYTNLSSEEVPLLGLDPAQSPKIIAYGSNKNSTNLEEIIFKDSEEMPRFPGCEDLESSINEREECAKQKMLEFIYKNIKYPKAARDGGIHGMNVVRFIVEIDGSISNVALVRDIGGTTGEETIRVTNLMNQMKEKWIPGRQRGQAVRVQYNLPVRFKLEESTAVKSSKELSDTKKVIVFTKDKSYFLEFEEHMIRSIKPDNIISVSVFKDKMLQEKYPEYASYDGLIEIHTKLSKKQLDKLYTNPTSHSIPKSNISDKETASELYGIVEQQPRFPGCEGIDGSHKQKNECAKQKMLEFIYKHIKYPKEARDQKVQGMNVVKFVVEKDGTLSNIEIIRSIGAGTDEVSIGIVEKMNQLDMRWTPGYQNGKAVRVVYNLPIRFKLSEEDETKKPYIQLFLKDGTKGDLIEKFSVDKISPDDIISISVLKGDKFKAKYPNLDSERGIVEVYTKWSKKKLKNQQLKIAENVQELKETKSTPIASPSDLILEDLLVFPNPAINQLTLMFTAEKSGINVQLIDYSGKEIYSNAVPNFDGLFNESIDLRQAAKGAAVIQVTQNGKVFTHKIIIAE